MISKQKREYYQRYNKEKLKRISLSLSLEKDKDIIQAISEEDPDNIQAGVKSLIRKAIKYNEQEKTFKYIED